MQSEHTRERLVVVSGAIETESGIPIAHMDRCHGNGTTPVERDDTAARMVLAYNVHSAWVDGVEGIRRMFASLDQLDLIDALRSAGYTDDPRDD